MTQTITGTFTSGYTLSNPAYTPFYVALNAKVTNVAGSALVDTLPANWTINNAGLIAATGASGLGLAAATGGALSNAATGQIEGVSFGVSIGGSGSVVNSGSISASQSTGASVTYANHQLTALSAGVVIGGGGVTNNANSTITGVLGGIAVGGAGSVLNAGVISSGTSGTIGYGVILEAGGTVTNQTGGVISGGRYGIVDAGGLVVNNQAGGTITGAFGGVFALSQPGTLTNQGRINDRYSLPTPANYAGRQINLYGVDFQAGGTVTNLTGGIILGHSYGVRIAGATGTVTNSGAIISYRSKGGAGVQLTQGGSVTNAIGGVIAAEWIGVQLGAFNTGATPQGPLGTLTLVNQGTIIAADGIGDGAAVWMYGAGTIINDPTGDIGGATHGSIVGNGAWNGVANGGFGIVAYYQTTVINYGTIGGVTFNAAAYNSGSVGPKQFAFDAANKSPTNVVSNLIEIAPGSSFGGVVKGADGNGAATLELLSGASAGSVVSFGSVTVSGAYYNGYLGFSAVNIDNGARWTLGGTVAAGKTIAFAAGGTGALTLANPAQMQGTIAHFAAGDTLALAGIISTTGLGPLSPTDQLAVNGTGLVLQFDSAATGLSFSESVSGGQTVITALCFCVDTLIETPTGPVKVQDLAAGDLVRTMGGAVRPIVWIGTGQVLATRGRRSAATPVIVRKGALADSVPTRDLRVTKGHSFYIDDVLIPVEFLVNHRSIAWDDRAQEVKLYHVELETHDVLIANGAPAESYRDDGNRWLFQNANSGWDLPAKPPCAPVLTGGPIVDAAWRRLLERAGPRPGWLLTDDPDLCLLVDGVRVDASVETPGPQGSVRVFALPNRPNSVRVASRAGAPQELGLARDPRVLGVGLRQIAVRQGTRFRVLDAADDRLAEGFHAYETEDALRWTDGDATVPAALFEGFEGPMELVLHVACGMRYSADSTLHAVA